MSNDSISTLVLKAGNVAPGKTVPVFLPLTQGFGREVNLALAVHSQRILVIPIF